MVTNSDNPLRDLGGGFGKGLGDSFIDSGSKGIKYFVEKFRSGKLAFIQERSTIDKAKDLLKSNEHLFYCTYVNDREKQTLMVMGLTLRKLDQESQRDKRDDLVKKIKNKFDIQGSHLSYLVQNGVLSKYITNLLENIDNPDIMKERLEDFLNNLDKFVYFVRSNQDINQVADIIKIKINANSPKTFIISGIGLAAEIVSETFKLIKNEILLEYDFESYSSEKSQIIFLNKKDNLE